MFAAPPVFELQTAPHTCFPWQVTGPSARVAERLSYAATYAPDILSTKTIRPYLRHGLGFFDYHQQLLSTAGSAYDPFGEPEDVLLLVIDFLRANHCRAVLRDGVWRIDAPAAFRQAALLAVLGLFAFYEGLRAEGMYRFPHPLKVAGDAARVVKKRLEDGTEVMVRPGRTLIRFNDLPGSVARVAEADLPGRMLAALEAAGVPASVLMMMRTMSIALGRLSELCLLSMLDWWVSEFGDEASAVNKGSRLIRVKREIWTGDHTMALHAFADNERALLDPEGRGLADFRLLAEKGDWEALRRAPMFPNARYATHPDDGFYSPGGVADVHLRPAFDAAGLLGVSSHHFRHAGVTRFLRWLKSLGLSAAEVAEWKRWFGAMMGWASWEEMMDRYSQPFREEDRRERAHQWLRGAPAAVVAIRSRAVDAVAAPATADFVTRPTDAGLAALVGPISDWRNPAPVVPVGAREAA